LSDKRGLYSPNADALKAQPGAKLAAPRLVAAGGAR
jgi:hypothetical protein